MALEMKVPSPGESISEVEIAQWLVSDGDYVEKDQEIAEIDSDKATLALPAEESGIIKLIAEEGEVVQVGQVVCIIDTDAKAPDGDAAPKAAAPKEEEKPNPMPQEPKKEADAPKTYATGTASPAARKLMAEENIQLQKGSGKDGRITKEDVIQAKASMGSAKATGGKRSSERKRMSSLRRKLAQRLVSVKNETAMLTTFNEIDMTAIFELRKQYKERFAATHGVGLGFMSFFTLAAVKALKEFPQVNAMIDGDELVLYDYCDISIAVSGPKGLMVPVIRNAENLSFAGVEHEVKRLATRVRDGVITVDEMTGGTFTITNGGVFGSMLSTPIINPPQSAILGMHNIVERPVVKNGGIQVAPIMYLALSYDHRVIDGRESVGSLVAMKKALENPIEELMDGNVEKALEI
ncbi:MAG: 2-oxoglutarate dehydrogenase complex dihydrolipoyllysine-residue succinyltransferase [Schleiferiaceae bacterium]|nr:2-oxoglutarate dehydrogenase complex dihydrolipoyllysine-residue succinyltransferase [Schleiferiaceae bacterium]